MRLIDRYNRQITYLRVSVTDRCNLRCIYCNPKGDLVPRLRHQDVLTYEEMLRIIDVATRLGIKKVRITGGEPFVRKDIDLFIKELSNMPGIEELTITTNGILLSEHIETLTTSAIKRINVSLDTLRPDRYKEITGYDGFHKVWEGIHKAKEAGFYPIKINVVILRGINEDEIMDFARLSIKEPFHIRFIEYMPMGQEEGNIGGVPGQRIRDMLSKTGKLLEVADDSSLYPGPARYFRFEGAKGMIGFIDPITSHFCDRCNRIRLTADGHLRPCLLWPHQIDIKTPIRNNIDDESIAHIIMKAVKEKPRANTNTNIPFIKDAMYMIGG